MQLPHDWQDAPKNEFSPIKGDKCVNGAGIPKVGPLETKDSMSVFK